MNLMCGKVPMSLLMIGLKPDEMLLESIREAARKKGVKNGIVVSGIGTLKNLRMHYITRTHFPVRDKTINIKRPLELLSVSGIIADGEPHLHVVVSCGKEEVYAGHLEEKSRIAYLGEIAILQCNGLKMARVPDARSGIRFLQPRSRRK